MNDEEFPKDVLPFEEEIKKYSTEFEVANVGTVIQVADGIARIH